MLLQISHDLPIRDHRLANTCSKHDTANVKKILFIFNQYMQLEIILVYFDEIVEWLAAKVCYTVVRRLSLRVRDLNADGVWYSILVNSK